MPHYIYIRTSKVVDTISSCLMTGALSRIALPTIHACFAVFFSKWLSVVLSYKLCKSLILLSNVLHVHNKGLISLT